MKCPHCLTAVHEKFQHFQLGRDADYGQFIIRAMVCPECNKATLFLDLHHAGTPDPPPRLVYPSATARPVPADVPAPLAADFTEAAIVLPYSPKASAALSRRCFQHLLHEYANIDEGNLAAEIEAFIHRPDYPSHLTEAVDSLRNIGNFAAHPLKSTNTGTILDVEPGEAEWLLDLLESFFDFFFVQPAALARRRDALNAKLTEVGKRPVKRPPPQP
jgi:hypothetical protein